MQSVLGGTYAFFREVWGRPFAFAFCWSYFWVIKAGSIAIINLIFARYFGMLMSKEAQQTSLPFLPFFLRVL